MGERVIILKLEDPEAAPKVIRTISQAIGLSFKEVRQKIQDLPWTLPIIVDLKQRQDLENELISFGCAIESPSGDQEPDHEEAEENFWPSSSLEEGSETAIGVPPPIPETTETTESKVEEQNEPAVIKKFLGIKKGHKRWALLMFVSMVTLIVWWAQTKKKSVTSKHTVGISVEGSNKSKPNSEKQSAVELSSQQLKKVLKSINKKKDYSNHFKKRIERNPDDGKIWSQWIEWLEENGDWDKANKLRENYFRRSSVVQKELKNLISKYGKSTKPAKVTEDKVKLNIKTVDKEPKSIFNRGYFLYRELRKLHGNKKMVGTMVTENDKQYLFTVPVIKKEMNKKEFSKYFKRAPGDKKRIRKKIEIH